MCDSLKTVIADSNTASGAISGGEEHPTGDDLDITEEQVSKEDDVETLQTWLKKLEDSEDSWEFLDLMDSIKQRIIAITAVGETVPEAAAVEGGDVPVLAVPLVTVPVVPPELKVLAKYQVGEFCDLCERDRVDAFRIVSAIKSASTGPVSLKAGFVAFLGGLELGRVLRLAACYEDLCACTRDSIDLDQVLGLVDDGLMTISRITYADNPRVAGSVYVFSFRSPQKDLKPEWHVHWGPQNTVLAASFKNLSDRKKTGQGVRTVTDGAMKSKLQSTIKQLGLWGPK